MFTYHYLFVCQDKRGIRYKKNVVRLISVNVRMKKKKKSKSYHAKVVASEKLYLNAKRNIMNKREISKLSF